MKQPAFLLFLSVGLLLFAFHTKQHPPASGAINAGAFTVYYERRGKGEPLLLLHAGLQDHTMWNKQVNALSADFDVITIDLPYHGNTTGNDTTLLAQDVVKIVLDSLHVSKAAVAGLSMGASVAEDFVIAYPDRVSKAIFISAGVNGYEKKFAIDSASLAWFSKYSQAMESGDTTQAAVEFTKAWAEGIYRSGDRLKKPASQYVYSTTLKNLRRHKAAGWPRLQNNPPAFETIAFIQVPVLIIDGDKDLPYITAASNTYRGTT